MKIKDIRINKRGNEYIISSLTTDKVVKVAGSCYLDSVYQAGEEYAYSVFVEKLQ